jgi:hypothetical protein
MIRPNFTPTRQAFKSIADEWATRATSCTTPYFHSKTMHISNIVFETSGAFRKIHVGYAKTHDDVEFLHSTAYPHMTYEVPILGIDLVTVAGKPALAICDLCLPGFSFQYWNDIAFELQNKHDLSTNRPLPDWAWLCSDSCICVENPDIDAFRNYVVELTSTYATIAELFPTTHDYYACHKAYCDAQRENFQTRDALAAGFSAKFAGEYMRFMFDVV